QVSLYDGELLFFASNDISSRHITTSNSYNSIKIMVGTFVSTIILSPQAAKCSLAFCLYHLCHFQRFWGQENFFCRNEVGSLTSDVNSPTNRYLSI
ncbi:MAG: hypothetical protein J6J01_11835, partial [Oscillospiraceae bacterium]|nr:hypothetical protein [Oscillospiraceae bacterium]